MQVTQNTRNLPVLVAMMSMVRALLENRNLFIEPYVRQQGFKRLQLRLTALGSLEFSHLSLGFLLIVAPAHADYFDMRRW
jgi:hypothetical protein